YTLQKMVHPARRMARPLRIEYPGEVYRVMPRGNLGRPIFKDDKDRKRFLETLEESCQKTGWEIAETERKLNAKSRCHNSRTDPCDGRIAKVASARIAKRREAVNNVAKIKGTDDEAAVNSDSLVSIHS